LAPILLLAPAGPSWLANHDGTLPIHMLKQWGRPLGRLISRLSRSSQESLASEAQFTRTLELVVDRGQLQGASMGYLGDLYGAERTLLLMREEEANELQEADRHGTAVPDRVAFSLTGRLVAWLEVNEVPLWLDRYGEVLDHLTATERDVLLKHRVDMCLPLMAMNRLVGLVLLGGLQWPEREVAPHILTQMGLALQNAVLYGQQQLRLRRLSRSERLATTGELAASAAHEIRNPLTAISSAVQVLGEAFPEGNPRRQVADNVMREIDRINQIVEGLLSFSRPTEEKREAVNLRPVLEEATRLAESSARPVNAPAIFNPCYSPYAEETSVLGCPSGVGFRGKA